MSPASASLDIALAHRLVSLASPAYFYDSFPAFAASRGYRHAEAFHESSIQAKLLEEEDRLLLVFTGTDLFNLREWFVYDFDMRRQPMLSGWIHRGFWRALHARSKRSEKDLFRQVTEAVAARLALRPLSLHVGGHSLGAAMAMAFAAELADHAARGIALPLSPDRIASIVTTGGPRLGNAAFAANFHVVYGGRFHRGVFGRDWVPNMPIPRLGYRHAGIPHFIERDGSLFANVERVYHRTSGADHLPQRYERAYGNRLRAEDGLPPLPIGRGFKQTCRDFYEVAFHPGRGRDRV